MGTDLLIPRITKVTGEWDPVRVLVVENAENPGTNQTIGNIGIAAKVTGPSQFPTSAALIQPFDPGTIQGIDLYSVRVFRWDTQRNSFSLVQSSGINREMSYTWAKIEHPGIYVPIGLPRDRLVQEMLKVVAYQHYFTDSLEQKKQIILNAIKLFTESKEDDLAEWRRVLSATEVQSTLDTFDDRDIIVGDAGTVQPFPFPLGATFHDFTNRLKNLDITAGELPEEKLFYNYPTPKDWDPRWSANRAGHRGPLDIPARREPPNIQFPSPFQLQFLSWFQSPDWPMYHHDEGLTGVTTGSSRITSTTVGRLILYRDLMLDGPLIGTASIVRGKIYVGTANSTTAEGGMGGTLYKVDIDSGTIENHFTFNTPFTQGSRQGYAGIGSSPSIADGKVFFSGLDGKLYCLDEPTFRPIWIVDLRNPDLAHNQPVQNFIGPNHGAEGWSSPLVVDRKVFVGFGEGESHGPNNFGFVYCINANIGNVIWLFCTNQFDGRSENTPNIIPPACLQNRQPPNPFRRASRDPPDRGVSPWSSCSFDRGLNRVYIGTGNALKGRTGVGANYVPLPDSKYGSGIISLDASTGEYKGFFQPDPQDSYRSSDIDIDIPAGPMLFSFDDGTRVLAIGSKNGSFFLLNAESMQVIARRQLLPKTSNGQPFPNVDKEPTVEDPTHPGNLYHENYSGVFATATVHYGFRRLFVGLGGYRGEDSIDHRVTPFMRALDWRTLNDAWATTGDNPPKYSSSEPPMYSTAGETGYSSPTVVNDIVFMSTVKKGLYAFDVQTGVCLWSAGNLGGRGYIRGPSIYGDYVVIGTHESRSQGKLKIYSL
jgi:outer membrane protein assembly factor BamB